MNDTAVLFQIIGFGVFLWLGSYLLVRARRLSPLIVVSVVGLLSQAAFFAAGALTDSTDDPGLLALMERGSWWSTVVPLATWFHFSRLIARSDRDSVPRLHELPLWLVYIAAALISLLGGLTDLFVVVEGGQIRPGAAYPVYIVYLALAVGGALVNFVRSLRRATTGPQQSRGLLPQLWLLVCGSLGFLAGALWLAAGYSWSLRLPEVPGYLCVLLGLGALGYGVAHFGLMLEGQRIERDFLYTVTSIALLNLLYLGLLVPAGAGAVPALLLLIALVTLTHTAYDKGRSLLDRLFFSQDEQDARAAAREYATSLGTDPVVPPELPEEELPATVQLAAVAGPPPAPVADPLPPPDPSSAPAQPDPGARKRFQDGVRRAISGIKNPPRLAQSDLLTLALVEQRVAQAGQEDNRLNRIAALRELLIDYIEGLRPTDGEARTATSDAWRFYNVLYYPYVRGVSRKAALAEARRLAEERRRQGRPAPDPQEQVLGWLADIDEDTFYKWQRRASDTIADILWEEEDAAGR
ncbi:MAG TPA: hypothetical protein VFS21_31110 [Roseiflexaceae bacterium]|nr:hypothetical protein [Roseiflexaceae bacterium]